MLQPPEHGESRGDVDADRNRGIAERRARILARKEAGRRDLDQHQRRQAEGERLQRRRRHARVPGIELAVMKHRSHQRDGKDKQRGGGRQREQDRHAKAPVQRRRETLAVILGMQPRQVRQQHRAKRDRDHPDRHLHQPVGVIQPGDAAGDEQRRENAADQPVDLVHRRREHGRTEQTADLAHARVAPVDPRRQQQFETTQRRKLEQQLGNAGDQHAPGESHRRFGKNRRRNERRADQRQVQQDGRERRHRIAVEAVQRGAGEGREGDEREVGERDAQHVRRQRQANVVADEAWREDNDQAESAEDARDRDDGQDEGEVARHRSHEVVQRATVTGAVLGENRHERLRKGAFGEQSPEKVRYPEGDEEGVRRARGTEKVGQDNVADESADAGKRRHGCDHRPRGRDVRRFRVGPPIRHG